MPARGATGLKTWSLLLVLAIVGNLTLMGGPWVDAAHACSCAGTGSTEEAYRRADAVFSGKVASVGRLPIPSEESTTLTMPYLNPVIFDVGAVWKGVSTDSAIVYGEGAEVSCGIDFDRGETYLVFANRSHEADGPLQTDFCGETEQTDAESARVILGPPPTLPDTGGLPYGRVEARTGGTLVAGVAALVALSAGVCCVWQAMRRRGL